MWAFLVIPHVTSTKLRIWILPLTAGPVVGTPTAVERRSSAKRLRPDSEPAQEELVRPEVPVKGAPAPATPLPTPPSSGQARYDGPAIQRASSAQTRLTFTEEAPVAEVDDAGGEPRVVVTIQVVHDPTMGTHPAGTLRPPSLPPELRPPEHDLGAGASRRESVSGGEAPSRSAAGSSHQGLAAREASKADDAAASLAVSAEAVEHLAAGPASAAEAAAERLMAAARGKGQRSQRPLPTSAAVPASPFALPTDAEGLGAAPGAAGSTAAAAVTGKGETGPSTLAPRAVVVHRAAPPPPPPPPPPAGAIQLCSAEDSVHAGLFVMSCVA